MAKYLITRQFKLMKGKLDGQYVSMIDSKGQPIGYDRKREYALELTEWQAVRVISYLNKVGAKHWSEQL